MKWHIISEGLRPCLAQGERQMGTCYADIVVVVTVGMEAGVEETFPQVTDNILNQYSYVSHVTLSSNSAWSAVLRGI